MERIIAKDKEYLKQLIKEEMAKNGNKCNLNHMDISGVTDLSYLFMKSEFNGDILEWDISHVKDMSRMFWGGSFNGEISKWDVSHVEDMEGMFMNSVFNGDLSGWSVSKVKDMWGMFMNSHFNGDISKWDISRVKNMRNMFIDCNAPVPWWYIEDNKERKDEIDRRKGMMDLKEKIKNEVKDKEGNKLIFNKVLKI